MGNDENRGRGDERTAPHGHEDPTARDTRRQHGARADAGGSSNAASRRNPPELDDVENSAGALSQSGGVAGGARGHAGSSDRVDPSNESRGGPAQFRATSRADLDHPSSDAGEPDDGSRDLRARDAALGGRDEGDGR